MARHIPLAERLRPRRLADVMGQEHLTGPGRPLSAMVAQGRPANLILWGPPGTGKTTLAHLIAQETGLEIVALSAVSTGVKEIRALIDRAVTADQTMVLFLDEIHRFNKAQQDVLLDPIERGFLVLIGATTENPSFELNRAVLSRCQVLVTRRLSEESLQVVIERGVAELSRAEASAFDTEVLGVIANLADGDGRRALTLLDMADRLTEGPITAATIRSMLEHQPIGYDRAGDEHYDVASAMIKSIRGSDVDAALYWMARMMSGGEPPEFIARRLVISAAEDIGLANPNALLLATATFEAVARVGWPESRIILSECIIYLALSPKSNSAYVAIGKALEAVTHHGTLPVPLHLRNPQTGLMRQQGYGKGYLYPHDYPNGYVVQNYLPDDLLGLRFYEPVVNSKEMAYYKAWEQVTQAGTPEKGKKS